MDVQAHAEPATLTSLMPGSAAQQEGTSTTFTLGTRNSQLALAQTAIASARLSASHPAHTFAVKGMTTVGDRNLNSPLYLMGGKALWTMDLEVAMLEGALDLVVHSLKDVPTALPPGCQLGAILEREDPRDALVVKDGLHYRSIAEFPKGSVIGTSSVRRVAQLRKRFPDLDFQDIRGNVNTRLRKLDAAESPFTAIILAVAGLVRIDLGHRITAYLEPPTLYHAVGQGAIALEVRDPAWRSPLVAAEQQAEHEKAQRRARTVQAMVRTLEHWPTAWRCEAERALLRTLEGGCSVPVGCSTRLTETVPRRGTLRLEGVVTSLDGSKEVLVEMTADVASAEDAAALGVRAAEQLKRDGADGILEELGRIKKEGEAEEQHRLGTRAEAVEVVTGTEIVDLGA